MATIGAGVTLRGQTQPESRYTFVLDAAIVAADAGKAVSIKAGSANTVKLSAVGDLLSVVCTLLRIGLSKVSRSAAWKHAAAFS